jgi:chromosome partitioning protein
MRSIAILSEKGGTGKTTSALNIAAGLAAAGERVLVVDADPQSNASHVLHPESAANAHKPCVAGVLLGTAAIAEAIVPSAWGGVDVCPARPELAQVNLQLAGELGREGRLREAFAAIDEARYTYCLVDCSPQRTLININALNAVGEVLVPVDPSQFSCVGLVQVREAVDKVRRFLPNQGLRISGLLLTRVRKDNVCRDVEKFMRDEFGALTLAATVPHNIKVEEAHWRRQSVISYAPRSPGAKAYLAVVEELRHGRKPREPAVSETQERDGARPSVDAPGHVRLDAA